MNAREYYYSVVAPEEKGKNYYQFRTEGQASYKDRAPHLGLTDDDFKFMEGYVPHASNDVLINDQLLEIIDKTNTNPRLKLRLQQMFIAKRRYLNFEAYATNSKAKYTGDLVFFHVGLSDACLQYATLHAEIIYVTSLIKELGTTGPGVLELMSRVATHSMQLAEGQKNWTARGDYIKLDVETDLLTEELPTPELTNMAYNLASLMDKFILGHEIAHHLLGHTGSLDDGSDILHSLPAACQMWNEKPLGQAQEFQADALSICLLTGLVDSDNISVQGIDRDWLIEACLGSMLTFTVLGQVSNDPMKSSSTHPSVYDRFKQCCCILSSITPKSLYQSIEADILRFQGILYKYQRRGLGRVYFH